MDWVTAVWAKINNPIAMIAGGVAIALFAPPEVKWVGIV